VVQAEKLDALLGENSGNGMGNLRVVQLLVPDETIVKRIAARRSCGSCGAIYHLETAPPATPDVCDRCGGALTARVDDTETAVRKRLQAFHGQTMPVVSYYRNKNLLREVDGVGPVDEVFERIRKSLN
jgi:adenylate kinase